MKGNLPRTIDAEVQRCSERMTTVRHEVVMQTGHEPSLLLVVTRDFLQRVMAMSGPMFATERAMAAEWNGIRVVVDDHATDPWRLFTEVRA